LNFLPPIENKTLVEEKENETEEQGIRHRIDRDLGIARQQGQSSAFAMQDIGYNNEERIDNDNLIMNVIKGPIQKASFPLNEQVDKARKKQERQAKQNGYCRVYREKKKAKAEMLMVKSESLQKENESLREKLSSIEEERAELVNKNESLQNEINYLRDMLSPINERFKKLKEQDDLLKNISYENSFLKERLNCVEPENQYLKTLNKTLMEKIADLQKESDLSNLALSIQGENSIYNSLRAD